MNTLKQKNKPVLSDILVASKRGLAVALVLTITSCERGNQQQRQQGQPQVSSEITADSVVPDAAPLASGAALSTSELLAKNYYLILDASGSMAGVGCSGEEAKLTVAKTALRHFIQEIPTKDHIGLLVFDKLGIREIAPLGTPPATVVDLAMRVQAGGDTPLLSALERGKTALDAQYQKQLGYGEYSLVVLTDGEANKGQDPRSIVDLISRSTPFVIHTVGFCVGEKHSLNQRGVTVYSAATNEQELTRGLAQVLAESENFDASAFSNTSSPTRKQPS